MHKKQLPKQFHYIFPSFSDVTAVIQACLLLYWSTATWNLIRYVTVVIRFASLIFIMLLPFPIYPGKSAIVILPLLYIQCCILYCFLYYIILPKQSRVCPSFLILAIWFAHITDPRQAKRAAQACCKRAFTFITTFNLFMFMCCKTQLEKILYTPISIKVASEKNDAWSTFHSPRCITVTSLVSFVPATSLEAQKANAADASMLCQQNVKTMYFKTLNPRLFNLGSDLRFGFSLWLYAYKCCKFSTSLLGSCIWEFWIEFKKNQIQGICSWTTYNK